MPGIADKFGRASLPTETSVATTVKTTRAAGVLVLEAFDLSKYSVDTPVFFVTYKKTTDPVTGLVSITNLVSWKALVNPGANTLTNLTVQPGYVDGGNAVGDFIECIPTSAWENSLIDGIFVGHNPDGSFKKSRLQTDLGNDGRLVDTLDEMTSDFVFTGGVWSLASGLNGTMTALAAYINGYKNTLAAIATRAFTINKDTYVDLLKDPSTHAFSVVYTEVANGAAAPALAANSIRLAKVVTNGSTITSVVQTGADGNTSASNMFLPQKPIGASQVQPKTYTDANGWSTYIHPGTGKRRYYRNGSWSLGYALSSGGFGAVGLGLTYPAVPYRIVHFTVQANDQAISATAGIYNNILAQSHYSSVTPSGNYQIELEET